MSKGQLTGFKTIHPVFRWFFSKAWKREKGWFFMLGTIALLDGITPLVNIVGTRFLINEITGDRQWQELALIAGIMISANLLFRGGRNFLDIRKHRPGTRLKLHFDRLLSAKCMNMDFADTERQETNDRLEKAKTGMEWYSGGIEGLADHLVTLLTALVSLSGTFVIISLLSPWMLLGLLAMVGVKLIFSVLDANKDARYMKEMVGINRRFQYFYRLLVDFYTGKELRLYRANEMVEDKVRYYIHEEMKIQNKKKRSRGIFWFASMLVDLLIQFLLYGWLGFNVLVKGMLLGDFQMLLTGSMKFTESLSNLFSVLVQIAKSCEFMIEYIYFIDIPESSTKEELPIPQQVKHRFEFQDVWFRYPQAPEDEYALKRVNLTVLEGEKLSIVGQNGAGKTTLIKLLCRLYDPARGRILLDGVDIRNYRQEEYWKLFGVVFQDFKFFPFKIHENLQYPLKNKALLEKALKQVGLMGKIEGLPRNLETHLYKQFEDDGVELSGGEQQKLAIARTLIKDAPVSILDEPTAALDPLAEEEVYSHFDQLIGGKTAIYISHRLSSCRLCDRIAYFHEGELTELGHFNELHKLPDGRFAELWNAQAQFYK